MTFEQTPENSVSESPQHSFEDTSQNPVDNARTKFVKNGSSRTVESPIWDTIIIGSGLGGMTSGCLLAKAGQKVLILERHNVPGGFTHTFKRKGFEWDVGVHYVGQMFAKFSILKKVFDYITDGKLLWEQMDLIYDRIVIKGDRYDYVAGIENQIQGLLKHFPNDEVAIRDYYTLVRETSRSAAWFIGEKTMPFWMSQLFGRFLRRKFEFWSAKTTMEVLRTFTQNEKLISVLCAQCGDYGMSPEKSSFGIHAIVVEHYIDGASYPIGGAKRIHESILNVFEKNGGMLRLKADVKQIVVERSRANIVERSRVKGVELRNGEIIRAKNVVSNAGFRNTFEHLLAPENRENFDDTDLQKQVSPSTAHFCLYVGLSATDTELKLPKNNIWVYGDYDFDRVIQAGRSNGAPAGELADALVYISFPSAKDPKRDEHNGGRATIQVIAACDYRTVEKWQDSSWQKRGDEYNEFKNDMQERMLNALIREVPQIEGHLVWTELSTPLSTRHFMNYSAGEIYGLEHSPTRFKLRSLRPQTKIKGLYLTGQDIVTVGVGAALYSGVLTATTILKKSVVTRILLNRPLKSIWKRALEKLTCNRRRD